MKETGIIMSGDHPQKCMDGTKTMTRRTYGLEKVNVEPDKWFPPIHRLDGMWSFLSKDTETELLIKCPYGQVGDRLWVRETFYHYPHPDSPKIYYKANDLPNGYKIYKWTPSIHMPRWASRITLKITDLRAERLQEISNEDAKAEGVIPMSCCLPGAYHYITPFKELWDSLNAKRGYGGEVNPWVFPISFKLLERRVK